ncbi:hypothetical protein IMCC21906_01907 [Spongiibacter sp. IMCC21906]|nr:hypothetical protein IMCC21906_01907 [Spongiibacter sp. IMCC21906]
MGLTAIGEVINKASVLGRNRFKVQVEGYSRTAASEVVIGSQQLFVSGKINDTEPTVSSGIKL